MSEAKWDLGAVTWIDADAIGEPGRRTFRLRMLSDELAATIWLEKEQLQMLGMYVGQLLTQLPEGMGRGALAGELLPDAAVNYPDEPMIDFRAYRLALGYDQESDMIAIIAHEVEETDEEDEGDETETDFGTLAAEVEAAVQSAAEAEAESEAEAEAGVPTLVCRVSRRQLAALTQKIERVVAAGRPRCLLCGAPMNPGQPHVCPRSNGHHKVDLSQLE